MIPNHCNFNIYSCQPGAVDNTSKSGFGPPGVFFPTAWVAFKSDVMVKNATEVFESSCALEELGKSKKTHGTLVEKNHTILQ